MTNQVSRPTLPFNNLSLLVRFLLVLAVSAFAALGFSSLAGHGGQIPGITIAVKLAGAAGIGLTTGFFTRILLTGRRTFLRLMVSLGGIVTGLLVLGAMTNWRYGIGPLYFFRSTIDWRGLGLLLGAVLCSQLASLAYRKPLRSSLAYSESLEQPVERRPGRRSQATTPSTRPARHVVTPAAKKPAAAPRKGKIKKPKRPAGKIVRKQPPAKQKKTAGAAVIRKRSSKKIVLAPVEVHRCPYCLEPVKRNDPRGVVECDICHTLHHADCWAITGTCQVPHYNH
jgi:hypothetical protein